MNCPSLCEQCGSPICKDKSQNCLRPWRKNSLHSIDSFSSRYLLIGRGYEVLRKWKSVGGSLFDRQVLISDARLFHEIKKLNPEYVTCIPQFFNRAWAKRGSRTETISHWLSRELNVPFHPMLKMHHKLNLTFHRVKRQAQMNLRERIQSQLKFSIQNSKWIKNREILLIDDFMTTGKTLNHAASLLKSAGAKRVHVFVLGIRLSRF